MIPAPPLPLIPLHVTRLVPLPTVLVAVWWVALPGDLWLSVGIPIGRN